MRVPAPADALRAARALLDISQREAAANAGIMQKSVSAAETSKGISLETNLALVDYYRRQGIEFLGEGIIGESIRRSGAKWIGPESPAGISINETLPHAETTDISFRAARALMGLNQFEVADRSSLTIDVVKGLERGINARRSYDSLRQWYEAQGIEFTGWGDVSRRMFFGVGVRWKA